MILNWFNFLPSSEDYGLEFTMFAAWKSRYYTGCVITSNLFSHNYKILKDLNGYIVFALQMGVLEIPALK